MQLPIQDVDYYASLKIIGWELQVLCIKPNNNHRSLTFWIDPEKTYVVKGCKKPQRPNTLKPGQEIISNDFVYKIISIHPPLRTDFKFIGNKCLRPNVYFATSFLLQDFYQKVCHNNEFNYKQTKQLMKQYNILSVQCIYAGLLLTTIFGDILYISGATFDEDCDPFLIQPHAENVIEFNQKQVYALQST